MMDRVLGCDVSRWQDDVATSQQVDFVRMRSAGARFVFVKASQGTWVDRDMVRNWEAAKEAGLYRGAYHYFDWRVDGEKQARFFAGLLKDDMGELPPVLDYEMRSGAPERFVAVERVRVFLDVVENVLGKRLMIYTSPGYWREYGSGGLVGERKLWLAHYYTNVPAVPREWKNWTFWQYTDFGDGPRFGVESRKLDLNWYNGDWEQFVAEFGELAVKPFDSRSAMMLKVEVDMLNVRAGPSLENLVVKKLRRGEQVTAEAVYVEDGNRVWVRHEAGWSALVFDGSQMMQGCYG